jgi:hypothetical protein
MGINCNYSSHIFSKLNNTIGRGCRYEGDLDIPRSDVAVKLGRLVKINRNPIFSNATHNGQIHNSSSLTMYVPS